MMDNHIMYCFIMDPSFRVIVDEICYEICYEIAPPAV
jgi:hypothetical protein